MEKEKEFDVICRECGSHIGTSDIEQQHPICEDCWLVYYAEDDGNY